jgi:bifunctional non-homologous end joining protein LigD
MAQMPRSRSQDRAARGADVAGMVGDTALSHPDRELWPGITKQRLAEYWQRIAPRALPEIAHRPLALLRCPEGIAGTRFFQKHAGRGLPAGIRAGEAEGQPYLAINDVAGLLACVQIAAIELHGWGATEADPAHPDRVVFDLDPGEGVPFTAVVQAALDLRDRLRGLGLDAFCRTTGGKGLHLVAPLDRSADWPAVRGFARGLAQALEAEAPERFVSTVPKAKRKGRILVDWLRNGPGATAICSYAPRARQGATVATPLAWQEMKARLDPTAFTILTVPRRLAGTDPWQGFASAARPLPRDTR